MLVPGDLGFRVAALFFFLVFPVIFFVFRRKWKLAAARREEINRLLVLASEEAARAELEASLSYSSPPNYSTTTTTSSSSSFTASTATYSSNNSSSFGAVPSQRFCAVCYTPTPNRCARCKAVNYCSGKCQIIHWRQGHKDECHPPAVSFETDQANTFAGNTVKQPYPGDYVDSLENDEIERAEQGNIVHEKPGISNPVSSPSKLWEKDDFDAYDKTLNGKTLDSLPEIHGSPDLTVAHESSSSDGMCIDGSISDDDSIHDLISDSCDSCNSLDNLETGLSNGDVEQTVLADEESYMRVEAEGNVSALDGHKEGDKTTDSLGSSISCSDKKSVGASLSTSDFWNGSLDSSRTRNFARSSNAKAKHSGSGDGKVPDLKPSVQLSFNLSDSSSLESHSQAPQVSVEPRPLSARAVKLVVEPTLPERKSTNDGRRRSSSIISSRIPDTRVKEFTVDGDTLKSEEVRPPVGTSKDNNLPSCGSKGAHDLDSTKDTSVSPISKKAGLSPKVSNGSSSSGAKGSSAPPVKSVKGSSNGTVAPQMSSSTPSAAAGLKTSMLKVVEQLRAPKFSKYDDSTGKSNEMGTFPYDFFVKLYHWNKIEFRPFGLINCGNSCYANVVLQCLAFTPPLAAYFLQGFHSKACAKKEWCFTCEFEKLVLKGKEGGSPLSPIGIVSQIPKIGSHLANGTEEDAHEFLRSAIETMQSVCLQEAKKSVSSSLEEETTLMGLTFGGYLRSKIKCTRCCGKSERHERMMDLTVEIEGDIETLEDALRQFTGTESLDGENKYHCGRCKSYEKAKKKLSISEAPNVLTIALKRFQSGKFGKLNKSIRIPEILNLAPYMRGSSDKSPIYRLYGVVVHLDIMNAAFSGHYVCYVRNMQNKWYKIDDSMVKPVEPDRVLNKGAYMLFYSRLSPRAPRSIRSTIVYRDLPNKVKNPVDPSRSSGRNIPRYRDQSLDANHIRDDLANLGYIHRDETSRIPHIFDIDSSSDNSSLFSHSDEVSSSTDTTRESISADDLSDYIFGYNGLWRHSLDSDASSSSSSSSSSSPVYSKHSPLSNAERYASTSCEPQSLQSGNAQAVRIGHPSWANIPLETCRAEESGSGAGVSFLQSNSSNMQSRKLVNISSCRGADSERLGWTNPLDNVNSGVHLRRSSRKKAD